MTIPQALRDSIQAETSRQVGKEIRRQARKDAVRKNAGAQHVAQHMARQSARTGQRSAIDELQARFDAELNPVEKAGLGQQLTLERLKKAHRQGRI